MYSTYRKKTCTQICIHTHNHTHIHACIHAQNIICTDILSHIYMNIHVYVQVKDVYEKEAITNIGHTAFDASNGVCVCACTLRFGNAVTTYMI